ncbi:hypothetical protein NUU61_005955 [Penicillium alfredii]|uniref:non-reducing end alpha-L-arabinofuranosidase n=1 Tax=Penicillium alfredii TaxID=1506179 RepID=A0A9W9F006_9EURO|nr:uncharacterized protein NUU61_005955 [Penicillium alfredii]KAJ5091085.1 hypothetical protein NUU61_005955 [Penicillium alfredii]
MIPQYILLPLLASYSTAVQISVAKSGGNVTSGLQYGAMEERINHCGKGGLYAESIRNRAFQGSAKYPSSLDTWSAVGDSSLSLQSLSSPLSSALPTSAKVKGNRTVGLSNEGFWGIDIRPQKYSRSFYVKGAYKGEFTASLKSATSEKTLASVKARSKSVVDDWVQHKFVLSPTKAASDTINTFSLTFDASKTSDSSLHFNLISLFPPTWNDRPNGMRKDLMQALKDLGPSYQKTLRLGLVEYMEWCDDLEMEPILGVWAGLAVNGDVVPEADLDSYIGYPEPWKIRYVEVGNEDNLNNGLSTYKAYRFSAFYNAITAKYPDIQVLASTIDMTIPGKAGGDYHLYDIPDNFITKFDMFDSFSPEHPILLGEIAATEYNNGVGVDWSSIDFSLYPWWIGSVAKAVFLGAERNADKIIGATYSPTMLSFNADPDQTVRSTSWHVYSLFNHNHLTNTLPATSPDAFGPLYYVAGHDNQTSSHIFKTAVYNSTADVPVSLSFEGVGRGSTAKLTVLTAPDAYSMNEVGGPNLVHSQTTRIKAGKKGVLSFKLPNLSVVVLKTDV